MLDLRVMDVQQAITALKTDTDNFLHSQQLKIFGSGIGPSFNGPANFKMEINPSGGFSAKFVTQDFAPLLQDQFQAWYIPMQQLKGFTANWLPGPVDTPIRLLLTSQISGCFFGVGTSGTQTCVAHIQPDKSTHQSSAYTDAQNLSFRQSDMRLSAHVTGLKTFAALGQTYGELDYVAVVGIMDENGGWEFFSQNMESLTKNIKGISRM
jgi:hypothetical protein